MAAVDERLEMDAWRALSPGAALSLEDGAAPAPTSAAEAGSTPMFTVDYRFRFSVSTSISSDTVIVFEFAW